MLLSSGVLVQLERMEDEPSEIVPDSAVRNGMIQIGLWKVSYDGVDLEQDNVDSLYFRSIILEGKMKCNSWDCGESQK